MSPVPVMVALGDSITVGVGDSVGADAVHGPGWSAHLAALLRADAFTNLANNGARSRDVHGTQLPAALALRPTLATVVVGGNDVLRSDFDPREVEHDLRATVGGLRSAGADVVLVRLPVIGLFELGPQMVRTVMRRRVAAVNAAVDAIAAQPPAGAGTAPDVGPAPGRLLVIDTARANAPSGPKAWHIDRVHPSPAGHRQLALGVATTLARADPRYARALGADVGRAERLPVAPHPPTLPQRAYWLVTAGLPWCVSRGSDFLPGLVRAVVADLRAERAFTPGSTLAGLADSGLDPRKRLGRR
ncbi:SGNH/GDSL hydrolase family protein [Antribacter sp. KLBMP9083]|uniref:SGNH/GDSL hydrolase family protein n=1 Tax=Antribacter soli TaxID=2910976 RepID=A0AA41U8Y1_9MICO|nr:SGNH/GDSL hydrolase family protein [Antribacter soli]MCF4123211.1 SGNH/GDSL hydrolase family protein [Antribacter soli]